VWGILRPGKAGITAPDGAAWLNWWTGIAGKAAAEGKRDELRTLYEANTAGWDQIALGSAEGQDVVAKAAEVVRAALRAPLPRNPGCGVREGSDRDEPDAQNAGE